MSIKINCFNCSDLIDLVKIQMSLYLLNILWTVRKLQEKNFILFTDKSSIKKINLSTVICMYFLYILDTRKNYIKAPQILQQQLNLNDCQNSKLNVFVQMVVS